MGTPSNPGWPDGYVPDDDEWLNAFSAKVDYPAPLDQGGTGGQDAPSANYNILQRQLIGTTPKALAAMTLYGLRTGVGALVVNLPALASLGPADWIELIDVDYAADTHNVTVNAFSGDSIALYDGSAASQTLNVAGVRAFLIVNTSSWRMIVG